MRPRAFLLCAAAALASAAVSAWSLSRHFEGGLSYEFCHYAEIGRNILAGAGYRTAAVYPATLAELDARGIRFDDGMPAPVHDRFPLQAWLAAAAEALGGREDSALELLSLLLLAACAAATCAAGLLLFGPMEGLLGGLCVALNPSLQRSFLLWGVPDIAFLLLTLATITALILAREPGRSNASWIAAGALSGLAWLARSNLVLWLPLFAWTLTLQRTGRSRRLLWFAAAFLIASSPGWIYNLRWFGALSPPTVAWNLAHLSVVPTEPWLHYRTFAVTEVLRGHLPALMRKACVYLLFYLRDIPTLWQLHLAFPFAILGAWDLLRSRDDDARPARAWTRLMLAMLAVQVVAFSFLRYETLGAHVRGRYLLWFAPAAFLLAARGASALGRRIGRERTVLWAFGILNAAFFIFWLLSPQGPKAHPEGLPVRDWPEIRAAPDFPKGLVITNLPAQLAWYARRAAIALPAEPLDAVEIAQRHDVSSILITRLPLGELDHTPGWRRLLEDPDSMEAFCGMADLWVARDFGTSLLLLRR